MSGPLFEAYLRQVRDRPRAEALWSRAEGLRLDFATLAERVESRRSQLRRSTEPKVGRDRRPLGLSVGNCAAFVEMFLAACAEDIAIVAIDAGSSLAERTELCRQLGVESLLYRPQSRSGLGSAAPGSESGPGNPAEEIDAAWPDGLVLRTLKPNVRCDSPPESAPEGPVRAPAGTALVKLTSGSTSRPVAACFDQRALVSGIRQIGEGMEIDERDRVVLAIPLSHSYGFDNGLSSLAVLGTGLVLEPSIFPGDLLRAVREAEGTFLPLVPPLVRGLARSRWPALPSLRRLICAGGLLPDDFVAELHATSGLWVHNFYGSTETGGISFERAPAEPDARGTVGHPLPGVEILLGEGTEARREPRREPRPESRREDRDEPGRGPWPELDGAGAPVRVRSPANLLGYLPGSGPGAGPGAEEKAAGVEATADSGARPRVVRTGDLATWTPAGRLRLEGRTAHLLNVGGRKIAVATVESALRGLAGVDDAAVVGVPDAMRGDRVVAFVVADTWPPDLGSLPAKLRPRELRRVDSLPHDGRGKLDRAALRRSASDAGRR